MAKTPFAMPQAWAEAPPMPQSRAAQARKAGKQSKKKSPYHRPELMREYERSFAIAEPTRWERFLEGLGISEEEALAAARGEPSWPRVKLVNYVQRHCRRSYIPEPVLAALGIRVREDMTVVRG